jgi:hypothetical protein
MALVACLLVGLLMLSIASYLLVKEIVFMHKATVFDATIIEVSKELVHKGKGSVPAYVPVIEVPDHGTLKIKVDTFSEEPAYNVGDKMKVLCDRSSPKCVRNTFIDKWGNSAMDFLLSFVFLSIPALYYWRLQRYTKFYRCFPGSLSFCLLLSESQP